MGLGPPRIKGKGRRAGVQRKDQWPLLGGFGKLRPGEPNIASLSIQHANTFRYIYIFIKGKDYPFKHIKHADII